MSQTDPRPLWLLARGGLPTLASSKRPPADAVWSAREGDAEWSPLDPSAPEPTISDHPGHVTSHRVSKFK